LIYHDFIIVWTFRGSPEEEKNDKNALGSLLLSVAQTNLVGRNLNKTFQKQLIHDISFKLS